MGLTIGMEIPQVVSLLRRLTPRPPRPPRPLIRKVALMLVLPNDRQKVLFDIKRKAENRHNDINLK